MADRLQRFLNLGVFVLLIAGNGLAASGAMSGASIGEIANRSPSLFLPANWVFGIWSLIYLGLAVVMVHQTLPTAGAARTVPRLGIWWLVSCALNMAWITLFSFAQFGGALLVMVALLVTLIILVDRLKDDVAWVRWPFDLYLAWISVALISNSFQYAHIIGFGGFGIPERLWSVMMMGVAALLASWMAWARGLWIFPFVVAWAVHGIGARYAGTPLVGQAADPIAVGAIGIGLAAWWLGRSARPRVA